MARSITFVIDDKVDTQITVTENVDGSLTFELQVLNTGKIGDLRALFFDLNGLVADGNLSVTGGSHVTQTVFSEASVDTVGGDGNINGTVTNSLGLFDVGIGFDAGADAGLHSTSFTLVHATQPLSLDLINIADFGIRTVSVGMKAGDQANGVGQNDALTVEENAAGSVDLLANDTGGTVLTVQGVSDAAGAFQTVSGGFQRQVALDGRILGVLTVSAAGIASFSATGADADTLALGETAQLGFTYRTVAADGSMATVDAVLTVIGRNDAPTLANGALALDNAAPAATLDLSALGDDIDSDDDGASLTYSLAAAPGIGTASIAGGVLTFDPGADFDDLAVGQTRDVVIGVIATDSHGATATGTVTVTVTGTNSAPVAQPDLTVTTEETVLTGNLFADNTAGADSDPDGDSFTIHTVDGQPAVFGVPITLSSGATLVLQANGDFVFDPRGAFDFVPEGGQSADGIWYTVIDSKGAVSNEVRADFSVQGVNDAPVARDDTLATAEDTPLAFTAADLLANDSDADLGQTPMLATINGVAATQGAVIATAHGAITVGAGGALSYAPGTHYGGTDQFTYQASDGTALSAPATVSIDIAPVADAPALALSGGGTAGGNLTPVPGGTDVQVNAVTTGGQFTPAITALQDGGYAIVWNSQETGNSAIRAQLYDATGAVRVPAVQVDAPSSSFQQNADVMQLDGGNLVVLSRGSVGGDVGNVFYQMLDLNGARIGGPVALSLLPAETGDGDPFFDNLKHDVQGDRLDGGGFVTVWTETLSNLGQPQENRVRASIFDASGQAVARDILIGGPSTTEYTYGSVSGLQGGGFVAAWTSQNSVFAQLYDATGTATGAAFQVSQHPLHTSGSPGTNSKLLVETLSNGNFVVSWSGDETNDLSSAANFRLYQADGTALTGQTRANTNLPLQQRDQSVTALDDGGFVMTWDSINQDGSGSGLYAQRFDATGAPVGAEYHATNTSAGAQQVTFGGRYTTTLNDGRVVTVWDQNGASGEIFHNIATVPAAANGTAGQPFDLNLSAALVDTDGSETLTVTLSGFPAGSTFNQGAAQGAVWVIDNAQALDLSTLQMTAPANFGGAFQLTATARATETANGDFAETTASTTLTIAAAPQPPLFTGGDDQINFGNPAAAAFGLVSAGSYQDGTQYDALGGNDTVYLPQTQAAANAAGYDLGHAFQAGAGNDFVEGSDLADAIDGGDGNDQLRGRTGNDTLTGGLGNDNIIGGDGSDVMDGGAGTDIANWLHDTAGVTVDIGAGMSTGNGTDSFANFETYWISNFDDTVIDDAGNHRIDLRAGNDVYTGGAGSVWLVAGDGDDTVDGGAGNDRIDYAGSAVGVSVDLATGIATGQGTDQLTGIEQIFGSNHGDLLIGDDTSNAGPGFSIGYNALFGRGGNDTIYGMGGDDDLSEGGDGDDQIFGGDGDDLLGGGAGYDTLDGGAGSDTAYYANMAEAANVNLVTGVATQAGWTDTLTAIENVTGSQGNDTIVGDAADNVLAGGFGSDTLTGGAGADVFLFDLRQAFSGNDVITDFQAGVDTVGFIGGSFTALADLNPQQVGADVLVTLTNGTTATLQNIALASLTDADFGF
ncbi:MAG: cadherin-like domain-containing protein [Roseivivax sp.]|nr:cadherin-like domain-containing protein [Roseivivax sp.]